MTDAGYRAFDPDPAVTAWAKAAHAVACEIAADPAKRAAQMRHGDTWFVGVDALPNEDDGSVSGVALDGEWRRTLSWSGGWHRAQLSIVYPGYPKQDPGESDQNHRYRILRHAAHVDGLLPIGSARRRYLREPHAFILGVPLNRSSSAPLMVWPGSHRVMGDALRRVIGDADPEQVDLTEEYQAARRIVFDTVEPRAIVMEPGQVVLLHRHLLHGVAPWTQESTAPPEGRMIAYFRPQFSAAQWLNAP